MRAIRIDRFGSGADVLQHVQMPTPKVHPRCVLIKNEYIGVNYLDINQRTGLIHIPVPCILGREGAGTVVAVGTSLAHQFAPGDRVAYLGNYTYAEYSCVCPKAIYKLPSSVSTETGAAVLLQGVMALALVTEAYKVKAGDWVLINAAAGGTGSLLVQICQQFGAKVIAVTSSPAKAQCLQNTLGVEHVLFYDQPDYAQEIKRLTFGRGVDVVYDSVGRTTFYTNLGCVRRGGNMVVFGCSSGKVPPIDIGILACNNVKLVKPTLFNYIPDRAEFDRFTYQLLDMVQRGQIKPLIHRIYPLAAIEHAHRDLESRSSVGKILLKP
ncbi:hypothetical protein BJ085DRAFT_20824 [Dimargaris cristalligena]|uniref:Enoyl reductase (ER) domain-containing protein n=1 Tax=Dimargaris cristalligena TaxID=215637 RepID=A0A4P9ZUK0_9FUNG|nr:hypothetical protein BJ085DRAFT_20824 [Dimargaris cristalligena]|eukprot:RKP36472.1 hypothetical protein BJ085DRAFT_20824 [Dimargaris cristalligena]